MELIDQVSINALSKRDLLLILKALEYTMKIQVLKILSILEII